ncbi:hypothetical protein Gbfr_010_117 [Gluconobacter frateurii M-2]|nr:hypothetical protein Gbfr_010_117 [Gluconobacter frateurii M-2]
MDAITRQTHGYHGTVCQTGKCYGARLDFFGRAARSIGRNGDEGTILQFPKSGPHNGRPTFILALAGRRPVNADNSPGTHGIGDQEAVSIPGNENPEFQARFVSGRPEPEGRSQGKGAVPESDYRSLIRLLQKVPGGS